MEKIFQEQPDLLCHDYCWDVYEDEKNSDNGEYLDTFSPLEANALTSTKGAHEYTEIHPAYLEHDSTYRGTPYESSVFVSKDAAFEQMQIDNQPCPTDRFEIDARVHEEEIIEGYETHHLDGSELPQEPYWKQKVDVIIKLLNAA